MWAVVGGAGCLHELRHVARLTEAGEILEAAMQLRERERVRTREREREREREGERERERQRERQGETERERERERGTAGECVRDGGRG